MQNIFAFCTICTKIYIKMIYFLAVYLKIIIFAPTNMEQGRMILLRIAGRTTQGKAYFGKALSNLLSVKVIMSLIETCKAKYKFRLTLKVPRCFCCQLIRQIQRTSSSITLITSAAPRTSPILRLTLRNLMPTCHTESYWWMNILHLRICHISSMVRNWMKKQGCTTMVQGI